MKAIVVLLVALAIAAPSQAFLMDTINSAINSVNSVINSVGNAITDTYNSVVDSAQSTINSIQQTIDNVQFVGQFLWDNAFGPSLDIFIQNGSAFIDNYFGDVINLFGKREAQVQAKIFERVFQLQASHLLDQFKVLFEQFIVSCQQIIQMNAIGLLLGTSNINTIINEVLNKFKELISSAVSTAIASLVGPLKSFNFAGLPEFLADLVQYLNGMGNLFIQELATLAQAIIGNVNQAVSQFVKP